MNWITPLLTFRCGACGTTVTNLLSYTYVLRVMREHDEFCKGFPPPPDARASDRSLVGAQPEDSVGALRQRAPETREGQS